MKKVIILGAGGHGKVVLDIILELGFEVLGFIDEDKTKHGQIINGFMDLGGWPVLEKERQAILALGIGNNEIRRMAFERAKQMGISVLTAVHPKAIISKSVKVGNGVIIMPGAVVNTGTHIEDGVVVNTGATVDHDCCLGKFCQIWPGAHLAGTVRVGAGSYIGTGASVIQNINIGKNTMVGAGAAVVADLPDRVTAVGVPAKIIKDMNYAKN
ncbi:acetyltransferase [Candidatus Margulisiibacteriota bacterium]